jgi:hypothetical protein
MNSVSVLQSEKKLVDVTGIEPVTPCLQSVRQRHCMGCDSQLPSTTEPMFMGGSSLSEAIHECDRV